MISTVRNINLVIDGGNFIHNGDGIGITTNRLISENETLSIGQIKEILKEKIKIGTLIILPVEPGDETGHIDGMVRFLNCETVVVAAYPDSESNDFMNNVADMVKAKFKKEPLRITNQIIEEDSRQIDSAYGNYLIFWESETQYLCRNTGLTLTKKLSRYIRNMRILSQSKKTSANYLN